MMKSILPFFVLSSLIFIAGSAGAAETGELRVAIEVKERSGTPSADRFVRRGVPFPEGVLTDADRLRLEDEAGEVYPLQTEVMKRHRDGSVQWVSAAFLPELAAHESRGFFLVDGGPADEPEGAVRLGEAEDGWFLANDALRVELGDNGIEGIRYRGLPVLAESGASPVVATGDGARHTWETTGMTVLAEGPVYATVRLTGRLAPLGMEAEWQFTLAAGTEHLEQDLRLISKEDVTLRTAGLELDFYPDFAFDDGGEPSVLSETSLRLHDGGRDLTALLHAPDIDRFRGTVRREDDPGAPANGWVRRSGPEGPGVLFAPIQYRGDWVWYDGVSRTARMDLFFGDTAAPPVASVRPAAHVEARQFVESGLLATAAQPPSARRAYAWVMGVVDHRDGHFEAGMIPQQIVYGEDGTVNVGGSQSRPGEAVYNLWYLQMQTGDPDLYRMLVEDAESWADVVVYRGRHDFLVGSDRYGSGSQYGTGRFFTSHPYYGDSSGLYLTHLMTGDPYFRETFRRMVDHSTEAAFRYTNSGEFHAPRRFNWGDRGFDPLPFIESRYILQARPLAYAEEMFGEPDYLRAVGQIGAWARHTQHEKGFWYQAYYDDGEPLTQSALDLPSAKNYIMLYGARGLVSAGDYLAAKEAAGDLDEAGREAMETISETLLIFSDYLLDEQQEQGWLWDPISDGGDFAAHTNEDMRRGQMPRQEIMAIEVLDGAYRMTGDERYLSGMLDMLRYYLAIQQKQGGWSSRNQHRHHEDGTVQGPVMGNNLAQFLRIVQRLQVGLAAEREKVGALGYRDVLAVLSPEAEDIRERFDHGFADGEVGFNAFATPAGDVIYLANYSGWQSGQWIKNVDLLATDEPRLYAGAENRISAAGTRIVAELEQFARLYALELPVTLTPADGVLEARVIGYRAGEFDVELRGSGAVRVVLEDGEFSVAGDRTSRVTLNGETVHRESGEGGRLAFELELEDPEKTVLLSVRHE